MPLSEGSAGDGCDNIDEECERLAQESQVLKDIYGAKIRQEVVWHFESPVVMMELDFGAITQTNPKKAI